MTNGRQGKICGLVLSCGLLLSAACAELDEPPQEVERVDPVGVVATPELAATCPGVIEDPAGMVRATCTGGSDDPTIHLSWTIPSGANSNGLQKGDAYPADSSRYWEFVPGIDMSTTTYTDEGVLTPFVEGNLYRYRIKHAPNWASNTIQVPISSCFCGCPGVVEDPTGAVSATCTGGTTYPRVELNWDIPAEANSNGLQKGDAYPADGGRFWEFVPGVTMSTTSYTDTGVLTPFQHGTTYSYRVKHAPSWASNTVKVPITQCNCGCEGVVEDPTGAVRATCTGGIYNPRVRLTWEIPYGADSNGLQKGDAYPADVNRFWEFVPGIGPQTAWYDDTGVLTPFVPWTVYSYRIKHAPNWASNTVKVPITPCFCGDSSHNVARNGTASQSSTYNGSSPAWKAIDGDTNGRWPTACTGKDNRPWWRVDLGSVKMVHSVNLWNRTDCCGNRLKNYKVQLDPDDCRFDNKVTVANISNQIAGSPTTHNFATQPARCVRVKLKESNYLQLAEVEVMGY